MGPQDYRDLRSVPSPTEGEYVPPVTPSSDLLEPL
jgi:hypothetical protein